MATPSGLQEAQEELSDPFEAPNFQVTKYVNRLFPNGKARNTSRNKRVSQRMGNWLKVAWCRGVFGGT